MGFKTQKLSLATLAALALIYGHNAVAQEESAATEELLEDSAVETVSYTHLRAHET